MSLTRPKFSQVHICIYMLALELEFLTTQDIVKYDSIQYLRGLDLTGLKQHPKGIIKPLT